MSNVRKILKAATSGSGLPLKLKRNPLYANFLNYAYMRFDQRTQQPLLISMAYNPIWNSRKSTDLQAFAKQQQISDIAPAMALAVFQHEVGHQDICPKTLDHSKLMWDAVASVLIKADKFSTKKTNHVVNLIADLIVNRQLGRTTPQFKAAFMMDYYDSVDRRSFMQGKTWQYLTHSDFIRPSPRKYSRLFGVFIGSLLGFFNEPTLDALFEPIMANAGAEDSAIDEIVELFNAIDSTQPGNWRKVSLNVTRILLPFIDKEDALPSLQPSGYFDNIDHDLPEAEVSADEWMFEVGPLFPDRHTHYERNASRIDFRRITETAHPPAIGLHLPVFFEPGFALDPAASSDTHLPENVLILVDASPSMGFGASEQALALDDPMPGTGDTSLLPWGDQSRFHAAALFAYGVLRYLREMRNNNDVSVKVATFSGNLRATPWFPPKDYAAYVPQILLDELSIRTVLNADRLDMLIGERSNVLLFLVTDGDLPDEASVRSVRDYLAMRSADLKFHLISIMQSGSLFNALTELNNGTTHFVADFHALHELGLGLLIKAMPESPSPPN